MTEKVSNDMRKLRVTCDCRCDGRGDGRGEK